MQTEAAQRADVSTRNDGSPRFSKAALELLAGAGTVRSNALDAVSHGVKFR